MKPSITHTQGFLDDCNSVTGWTIHDSGLGATLSVENDDWLKITGTPDAVGDEYTYWEKDITNTDTVLHPKLLVRWKTYTPDNGLQAKISAVYDDASSTDTTLGFSSMTHWAWKTTIIDLTAGKMLDKIRIYADDNPDGAASYGLCYVWFDFIMVANIFTFPNCQGGLQFTPASRYGASPIPSRMGDITQFLGSGSATVDSSSNLDIGNWKRTLDTVNGEVFMDIAHNSFKEPFQWLDTGTEQFKATLDKPVFRREVNGSKTSHMLDLTFKEYRRCNANLESYSERFDTQV